MARILAPLALFLAGSVSAFAAADSGLLSLLPADTQMVASINVDSSRSSSFGQFMLRQMSSNDNSFQELVQQTGFDPRRDLQTLVVAGLPSTEEQAGHGRFLVLARGIFNEKLIAARAAEKGMTSTSVGGTALLISRDASGALAFPEVGIAAFGDRASVQQALLNRANPVVLSPDLKAQIAAASGKNDAWFASTVAGSSLMAKLPSAVGSMKESQQGSQVLQAVLQSSGGIRFGTKIHLSFNALTRSDKDATSLTDLIRFLSSAIQMQRQNDPRAALLAPAMDSMTLQADGKQVHTSLYIPEADLEQIMSAHQPAHNRRAR